MTKKPGSDQRNSIGSEQLLGQVVADEGVDDEGFPVASAIIRLVGDLQALGGDPHAVVNSRGAVTWTHAITGFEGSLWNCWQKYVARSVAGITWAEFRKEAAEYNPSLRETAGVMTAGQRYFLPENRTYSDMRNIVPDIVWDRVLKDFDGDLWGCWSRYVQGKVIGLSWEAFRTQVNEHNPGLFEGRSGREMARRGRRIVLPRNEPANEYARVVYADHAGRFTFENLPPGTYRIEINADGFIPYTGEVTAPTETRLILYLQPVVIVIARGDPFVRVAGRDFAVDGRRFRFLGVNLRGLVHYQLSDPVRHANAHQQLSTARDMGARVIRVFVPHHEISAEETKNRLQSLLGLMEQQFPNMYLILALCNLYGDVNFRVNGDANEGPNNVYNLQPGGSGAHILGLDWFANGYKRSFVPFVQAIVTAFQNNPRIMAYNIGNELKAEGAPDLLIGFMHDMARQMRQWDGGNHLITTGMISTRHAHMGFRQDLREYLYRHPDIDFITNHAYHGDDDPNTNRDQENDAPSREDDTDLSIKLNKPLLIEEAGFVGHGDRTAWYEKELRVLLDEKRAGGYMPWGFMAGHDNGDGDSELGIDHIWHNADWARLNEVLRGRAAALAADNGEVAPPPRPRPSNKWEIGQVLFTQGSANMRKAAGLSADIVRQLPGQTRVTVAGPAQPADGLVWWPVSVEPAGGGVDGFIAQTTPGGSVLLRA